MTDLVGKVALVTGAASGIGHAIAARFVADGARVLLADIAPEGAAVADKLGASYIACDVSSVEDWERAIGHADKLFGRLDILVNNAGINPLSSLRRTSLEMYERVIRVNQTSVFLGMKAAADLMIKSGGGSIINVVSLAALRAMPGAFAYSTAKWAVRGMTLCAAMELAGKNIRVNAIYPGYIDTPMLAANPPGFNDTILDKLVVKRLGLPQDIASAAAYLASDDSSYMTGAELTVDGGAALK